MASYTVTGAGNSDYNGTYEEDGIINSKTSYSNGWATMSWNGSDGWEMRGQAPGPPAYFITAEDPPGEWSVGTGSPPGPTVALDEEPEPGAGSPAGYYGRRRK